VPRPPGTRFGPSLVGPGEPCFAEDVPGHGRADILAAGQPRQRDRLVHGEQPEYVVMWIITRRRRRPQVPGPAEAVGSGCGFGRFLTPGSALAGRAEVTWHPVHEASPDGGVRVIGEQDQHGGALGHAVPGQGRGQISLLMVEPGRDRGAWLERGAAQRQRHRLIVECRALTRKDNRIGILATWFRRRGGGSWSDGEVRRRSAPG